MSTCCGPSRGSIGVSDPRPAGEIGAGELSADGRSAGDASPPSSRPHRDGMLPIAAGVFAMGNESADAFPGDGEGPVRTVHVGEFLIDATAVTNAAFADFVEATGYVTEAERFGWSFVFDGLIAERDRGAVVDGTVPGAPWWSAVRGAYWAHPVGRHSDTAAVAEHPVVHVSWNDAAAYAAWAGKRLPTEAEWEKACRGGLERATFPWGNELQPGGEHRMNVWQGEFPSRNSVADGYAATAPADAFAPNGFGLYNTTGNVWEWVSDRFSAHWHTRDQPRTRRDPTGPPAGPARVIRGGSYLCHASYCNRYRTAGRSGNTADSTTGHMGFRCAADATNTLAADANPAEATG